MLSYFDSETKSVIKDTDVLTWGKKPCHQRIIPCLFSLKAVIIEMTSMIYIAFRTSWHLPHAITYYYTLLFDNTIHISWDRKMGGKRWNFNWPTPPPLVWKIKKKGKNMVLTQYKMSLAVIFFIPPECFCIIKFHKFRSLLFTYFFPFTRWQRKVSNYRMQKREAIMIHSFNNVGVHCLYIADDFWQAIDRWIGNVRRWNGSTVRWK